MPYTLAASAIAAFVIVTMPLCFIVKQRGQTHKKRVSVSAPVIDICHKEDLHVDGDPSVVEPQRPSEAYLSTRQSSPGIWVVARYEDASSQMGLHGPFGRAKGDLDLEAQSWKPAREKRSAKAERSHTLSCTSLAVDIPISPPPSYSQIDKSPLVLLPSRVEGMFRCSC